MADGDSGIDGELGTYSEDTNAAEIPKENGEGDHVEETYENHTETVVTETHDEPAPPAAEEDDRPVVELFVKAAVDKMKNGGCPICHRYFMLFYLLREQGLIDLVVTTFMPETPPKEVTDFFNTKRYPLVYVHKGVSQSGISLVGPYENTDEIEDLVKAFRSEIISTRHESVDESEAESKFDDLYKKFNGYLKDDKNDNPQPVIRILEKVNDHLRSEETRFMVTNELRRADCHLLPWLQHIRVAGKAYRNFEIPTELTYLWRYLQNSYETDAFKESCPADREIITHYQDRLPYARAKLGKKATLMEERRTFSIPPEITNGE